METPLKILQSALTSPSGNTSHNKSVAGVVTAVEQGREGQKLTVQTPAGRVQVMAEGQFSPGQTVRLDPETLQASNPSLLAYLSGERTPAFRADTLSTLRMAVLREFQAKLVEWQAGRPELPQRQPLFELMKDIASQPGGRDFILQLARQLFAEFGGHLPSALMPGPNGAAAVLPDSPTEFARLILQSLFRGWAPSTPTTGPHSAPLLHPPFREPTETQLLPKLVQVLTREPALPFAASSATAGIQKEIAPAPLFATPATPATSVSPVPLPANLVPPVLPVSLPANPIFPAPTAAVPSSPASPIASLNPILGEPVFRYTLDAGTWTAEAFSRESRTPGEAVPVRLERVDGTLRAHFLPITSVLSPEVLLALPQKTAAPHPAFFAAQEFLGDFKSEKFFPQLVRDFGEILRAGGRYDPPANAEAPIRNLPAPRELEGLLRLFLSFPVEPRAAAQQGNIWSGMQSPLDSRLTQWLGHFQPGSAAGSALLTEELGLKPSTQGAPTSASGPSGGLAPAPMEAAAENALQKAPPWERLPEGLTTAKLREWLMEEASLQPREAAARKFLQQALSVHLARAGEFTEGENHPAQVWHQGQWQGLRVLWRRQGKSGEGDDANKAFAFAVETTMPQLGQVEVKVKVLPEGASLDFRSENPAARGLLAGAIKELETRLDHLDFKVKSFTFTSWLVNDPTRDKIDKNDKNLDNLASRGLDIRA